MPCRTDTHSCAMCTDTHSCAMCTDTHSCAMCTDTHSCAMCTDTHSCAMCTDTHSCAMCTDTHSCAMCTDTHSCAMCTDTHSCAMCTDTHSCAMCTDNHSVPCTDTKVILKCCFARKKRQTINWIDEMYWKFSCCVLFFHPFILLVNCIFGWVSLHEVSVALTVAGRGCRVSCVAISPAVTRRCLSAVNFTASV